MTLFGSRKTRSTRVASLRASSSFAARLDLLLRDRNVLLRLLVSVGGVALLVVAVQGWKPAFPHRLGDRVDNGIASSVYFEVINAEETRRARDARLLLVPFVFRHDPSPLPGVIELLRSHLGAVAEKKQFAQLPPEVRESFGLVSETDDADSFAGLSQEFQTLKAELASGGESVGTRIDELVADFEQLIIPILENGTIDPADLNRKEIVELSRKEIVDQSERRPPSEHPIEVHSTERATPGTAILGEQQLSELIKDSGHVGKAWSIFPRLQRIRSQLQDWTLRNVPVTLQFDMDATLRARDLAARSVGIKYDTFQQGSWLVEPGDVIDEPALTLLLKEYDWRESRTALHQQILRLVTVFLMFTVMAVLFGAYVVRNEPMLAAGTRHLIVFLAGCVATAALSRSLSFDPWRAEIIPLMALSMVVAIVFNQVLAMLTALTLSLVIALATIPELGQFVILMSVSVTSMIPMARVASRSALIKVGVLAAGVYLIISWGTLAVGSRSPTDLLTDTAVLTRCLKGAGWCLVCGYLVAGSLPFIESRFGVVTDISLKEMSDISHPLLQELVHAAPGTYNHSIAVATLGEAAADAIGANGLLVRVGAYFHDIGKILKPEYFIENISGEARSRHERLAPAMSTLIIIGHVKDGVDLARQHTLPGPLIDFIEQHHGTTLVEYFYHEATRKADDDHKTDAQESTFRYPGPKPQTREAGVMMLADSVESASRTLSDPTPKRIESLVHKVTMKRLLDGQFDECSLKLSEIHTVEESLIKSLIGIYHGRVKYPEQQTA